jgi:hypothetical protein
MRPREEHPRTRVREPKTRNALQFPVLQMQGVPVSPNPAAAKSELTAMSAVASRSLFRASTKSKNRKPACADGMDELRVDR